MLLDAMIQAPLCAISKRWPRVVHAAPMDAMPDVYLHGRTITAPCGARRLRLLARTSRPLLWPPPSVAADLKRCRSCWELTGRKRPRSPRSLFVRRP